MEKVTLIAIRKIAFQRYHLRTVLSWWFVETKKEPDIKHRQE